ncbi:MAG: hypothetical protein ACM36C_14260 [Acidobacteriota bacterium]
MKVLYPKGAGLDVQSGSVTACARLASGAQVTYEHLTVPTTTRGLLELAEWLRPTRAPGWRSTLTVELMFGPPPADV